MAKKKSPPPSNRKHFFLFAALLLLVTFGLYYQVTGFEFVNYDDDTLITKNKVVVDALVPWTEVFQWNIFSPHFKPLVLLFWRAEYQSFGENPAVFHFNNLLLHAFNVLLVFLLSLRLLKPLLPEKKQLIPLAAFFLALAFSVHPLHAESVAWAVERKDVLYTFFFLLSWWAYLLYVEKQKYTWLLLSALFYLLVILSKSMGITLIAVLFLTDYLYGRKQVLSLVKEKIPVMLIFFLGVYLYGLLGYMGNFFEGGAVGATANLPESIKAASEANPMLQLMLMMFLKVFLLLAHVLIPLHLSVIYEGPQIQQSLGAFLYFIPFILAGLMYLGYRLRDRNREVLFGLLFFLITVSPAIAIGKYGGVGVFVGDRYTYTPLLGIMLILVVLLFRLPVKTKSIPAVALSAICALYAILAWPAIRKWQNSETLWTDAISKTKCAAPAYNGRGVYYLDDLKDNNRALEDFSAAIACDSTHHRALYNRGLILMNKNKNDEALQDYRRALRLNPNYVEAYVNKGNILRDRGENDEAMEDYNTAIRLSPQFSKAYFNRGNLLLNLKRFDEAIADYNQAITIDRNYAKAFYNRGLAYFNQNQKDTACKDFQTSLQLGYEGAAKTIGTYCQ